LQSLAQNVSSHLSPNPATGNILHCDVKPDNWVLCSSNDTDGADLMLVDYGRAIDLSDHANSNVDPLDIKMIGDAAEPDMQCVSMRKKRPWSFDSDTFGICASLHVLLFGTHIDIIQNGEKRWMPRQRFKRYWANELWTEVFDTLLNLEEGTTIGSRPKTLRILREKLEGYLNKNKQKLQNLLTRQARLLPNSRLDLNQTS
jgi:checkpoint serine/threonine-protein kinase